MERSLVLIKPDGVQRGLIGAIIARLESRGLKIVAMKMLQMDKDLAEKHYGIHKSKPFFNSLVDFITSSPIVAAVFEGENAVDIIRRTMGETDSAKASPGTVRGDFGLDVQYNLVHGSDSVENAGVEINNFFAPKEIIEYSRSIDSWLTGS
jgi:nucleoside-diphosphate kinase